MVLVRPESSWITLALNGWNTRRNNNLLIELSRERVMLRERSESVKIESLERLYVLLLVSPIILILVRREDFPVETRERGCDVI